MVRASAAGWLQVPSKALLACAKHFVNAKDSETRAYGVRVAGGDEATSCDFGAVMERMRKIRADIAAADSVQRFTGLWTAGQGGVGGPRCER